MPPRISQNKALRVIGMWQAGRKQRDIAAQLRMNTGTVCKLIQRYRQHRHVRPGVSTGRPRKTTFRQDRVLYRMCRQGRTQSAESLR